MPEGEGVQLVGLAEAFRDMERWASQLGPAVENDARSFAESVRSKVAGEVPVLTGTLAASVEVVDEEGGVGVAIGDGVDYAGWIEFGGSRGRDLIPEGRYLYPTALAAEDEFAKVAADIADDTARRFAWNTPART